VSILVEIAEKADVPVEGVIRVLTREPVSDAVAQRVLDALDHLTPEQTRVV
jgi:DNA-binding LacI/PurR family transcriptional regulator